MQGQLKQQQLRFDKFDVHLSLQTMLNITMMKMTILNTTTMKMTMQNMTMMDRARVLWGDHLAPAPRPNCCRAEQLLFLFLFSLSSKVFFLGARFSSFISGKGFAFFFGQDICYFLEMIFSYLYGYHLSLTLLGTANGFFPLIFFGRFFLALSPQKFQVLVMPKSISPL